jgi:poly(3-hydroxybutyrate) depolymerase
LAEGRASRIVCFVLAAPPPRSVPGTVLRRPAPVRELTIRYRSHTGAMRSAIVLLPSWYGRRDDPAIPLVISPHGRGIDAADNAGRWGGLPTRGGFAVVNPMGQGRRLKLYSWGDPGQIDDLARMPTFLHRALPWLRIDRRRIYAFGGSMGGQESLLLAARDAHLLAGVASFDAPTNLALRYLDFARLRHGLRLRQLARIEVGGTPRQDPRAYAIRSPLDFARRLAFSGVRLQVWWSTRDRVVVDARRQSELLCREILGFDRRAPLLEVAGAWRHDAEFRWSTGLPAALRSFGLLPGAWHVPGTVHAWSAASAASTSPSVL